MNEERLEILRTIESGKISAEEGAKLLSAVETAPGSESSGRKAKFLRIKVYDTQSGKSQVNINLPIRLLDFAVKFIPKNLEATKGIDVAGLIEAAKAGAVGKIIDVTDEEKNQHVEVCIE
ncbi:MAG TPA: hypothetical protein VGL40_06480 [Bacillota bacterium]|jgi:hypothetical protein